MSNLQKSSKTQSTNAICIFFLISDMAGCKYSDHLPVVRKLRRKIKCVIDIYICDIVHEDTKFSRIREFRYSELGKSNYIMLKPEKSWTKM